MSAGSLECSIVRGVSLISLVGIIKVVDAAVGDAPGGLRVKFSTQPGSNFWKVYFFCIFFF